MDLSSKVLGLSVVTQLQNRIATPILTIGADKFTRGDFSRADCFNFTAVLNIERVCKELRVKNTRDLFNRVSPLAFAVPRFGAISMAALGAVFELKGVGGEHPLEAWWAKHSEHGADDIRTFHTLKHRVNAEALEEKKAAKAHKRSRTQKAREIRGTRILERAEAAAHDEGN